MSKLLPCVLLVALPLAVGACARHVVLEPEYAQTLDNKQWTVVSTPAPMTPDASTPDAAR